MHRVRIADESDVQESADRGGPNWVWLVDGGCVPERYRDNLNIRHLHLIWPREIWTHTLFGHSLELWVGSVNMKTHSCPHYSSARISTFLTHTSSSSAFPIIPSLLPVLLSLHLAVYPSLPPPRSGFPVQFHILNIFSISHRLTIHVHTPYLPPPPSRSL